MTRHHRKSRIAEGVMFVAVVIFLVGVWFFGKGDEQTAVKSDANSTNQAETVPSPGSKPVPNAEYYSVDDATSRWVVVNKGRTLPSDYVPASLVAPSVSLSGSGASDNMHLGKEAATSLEQLFSAATRANIKLMLVSGYRSYSTQNSVYSNFVKSQGQAYADSTSARPGHSEHQTGLAADVGAISRVCELDPCFGNTPEGKWLSVNANKYGYIVRYQKGWRSLTGYDYEPWHIRYVGTDVASRLSRTNQTLEQYMGLPASADYPAIPFRLKANY